MQLEGGYNAAPSPNKKLYNAGSEWQDDIEGLADYYSTFFREYDPMIGRFNGVDPMSEGSENISIYTYANNNPVMMNDPMGNKPKELKDIMQEEYRNWHDSRYGNPWDFTIGGFEAVEGGGGEDMSPYSSAGLYMKLKSDLYFEEGIPKYHNGQYGFWENFVGNEYEMGGGTMTGVTPAVRFVSVPEINPKTPSKPPSNKKSPYSALALALSITDLTAIKIFEKGFFEAARAAKTSTGAKVFTKGKIAVKNISRGIGVINVVLTIFEGQSNSWELHTKIDLATGLISIASPVFGVIYGVADIATLIYTKKSISENIETWAKSLDFGSNIDPDFLHNAKSGQGRY